MKYCNQGTTLGTFTTHSFTTLDEAKLACTQNEDCLMLYNNCNCDNSDYSDNSDESSLMIMMIMLLTVSRGFQCLD